MSEVGFSLEVVRGFAGYMPGSLPGSLQGVQYNVCDRHCICTVALSATGSLISTFLQYPLREGLN